jgi:anthranilate synthase
MKERMDTGIFTPDITVLSPGPGSPSDFQLKETIDAMIARKIPIFGVCLGLQGLVEYFGGELGILGYPMHGKPSIISRSFADDEEQTASDSAAYGGPEVHDVLRGLPSDFQVARYHSLHGKRTSLPKELVVIATSPDDVVMAIQHATLPIAAVQFHPESILTLPKHGMKILTNALEILKTEHYN